MRRLLTILVLFAALPAAADEFKGTPNGLAMTPPMGWNSWNKFGCHVDEATIRGAADAMVSSGMKDAGYQYVIIDDCWHGARDAHGDIQPDAKKFPSGMKALADYIHAKGLKFGIYSDAGTKTCAGYPGSLGHEAEDARQYAAWGADYLKYDWCNTDGQDAVQSYLKMSGALQATGRPIVFSICEWGTAKPWVWARNIGNLWRTTGDIYDRWEGRGIYSFGMLDILDKQPGLDRYAGPGHWNDPDMLEVGNGGMSESEYRAHFSLWAVLAAPLIAGNDLAAMDDRTRAILTNTEVIAVDQDKLGIEGTRVMKNGDFEAWSRPIEGGGRAVVLLNRSRKPATVAVTFAQLGLATDSTAKVRDLWRHAGLADARGSLSAAVAGHAAVMVTIKP